MSDLSRICFDVEPGFATAVQGVSNPREQLEMLAAYYERQSNPEHAGRAPQTAEYPLRQSLEIAREARGDLSAPLDHENASIPGRTDRSALSAGQEAADLVERRYRELESAVEAVPATGHDPEDLRTRFGRWVGGEPIDAGWEIVDTPGRERRSGTRVAGLRGGAGHLDQTVSARAIVGLWRAESKPPRWRSEHLQELDRALESWMRARDSVSAVSAEKAARLAAVFRAARSWQDWRKDTGKQGASKREQALENLIRRIVQMDPMAVRDAVVRHAGNLSAAETRQLSGEICYDSMARFLYMSGYVTRARHDVWPRTTEGAEKYLVSTGDLAVRAPLDIPAGHVVGIFRRLAEGGPRRLSHVMLSLGEGRAIGSNNGLLGGAGTWSVHHLGSFEDEHGVVRNGLLSWPTVTETGNGPVAHTEQGPGWFVERSVFVRPVEQAIAIFGDPDRLVGPSPAQSENSGGQEAVPLESEPVQEDAEVVAGPAQVLPYRGLPLWAGVGPAQEIRGFEAWLVRRGSQKKYENRVVVRVFFDLQTDADGRTPTPDQVREVTKRAQQGIDAHYNTGARLLNGGLLRVVFERVDSPEAAHHVVKLHMKWDRADSDNWSVTTEDDVIAHELGHEFGGFPDEYREASRGPRPIHDDRALMAGYLVDRFGRAVVDNDRLPAFRRPARMGIPPRHLLMLSAVFDLYLGTAGLRQDGEVVFATEDVVAPRPDALPARAHFSLDVRQAVLYGDARTGHGGLLPPRGMSSRPRPVQVGEANPNGTFRAQLPAAPGQVSGPRSDTRVHAIAGDLAVPGPEQPATQMMFPSHWTEEHAVYAAMQAYLDALRNQRVVAVPDEPDTLTWVGVYGGVRIEGMLRRGEFTGFRVSEDQAGLEPPAYMPAPEAVVAQGPGFGQRVEDVASYGDRRTRTGAHHPSVEGRLQGLHGLQLNWVKQLDNGSSRARIYFLDSEIRPGGPMDLVSRRRLHADDATGIGTVLFPDTWSPDQVLNAVEEAQARAVEAGQAKPVDDRTYHWIGETAGGVRIEGLVRDGQHVAYRPTAVQPHRRWPQDEQPVAHTAPAQVPVSMPDWKRPVNLDVQHVLFANGQRGIRLTAHVHLTPKPRIVGPDKVTSILTRLQTTATRLYTGQKRADGAPPVQFTVVQDDQPTATAWTRQVGSKATRHEIGADPKDVHIEGILNHLFGIKPDPGQIRQLAARAVLGHDRDLTWLPPAGTDPQAAQTVIDEALRAGNPLAESTTLREPDPAALGAPRDVPTALQEVERFFRSDATLTVDEAATLPPEWTNEDLLAAAYETLKWWHEGVQNPRLEVVWEGGEGEQGAAIVRGRFGDVELDVEIQPDAHGVLKIVSAYAKSASDAKSASEHTDTDAVANPRASHSPASVAGQADNGRHENGGPGLAADEEGFGLDVRTPSPAEDAAVSALRERGAPGGSSAGVLEDEPAEAGAVREAIERQPGGRAATRPSAVGVGTDGHAELAEPSRFRTDVKDQVESVLRTAGRTAAVTFEQLIAAWQSLTEWQQALPVAQLADLLAANEIFGADDTVGQFGPPGTDQLSVRAEAQHADDTYVADGEAGPTRTDPEMSVSRLVAFLNEPHTVAGENATRDVAVGDVAADVGVPDEVLSGPAAQALRAWSGSFDEEVEGLVYRLEEAGTGARALVIPERPGAPLRAWWAVNHGGAIRWMTNELELAAPPQSEEGPFASIEMDDHSNVLGPVGKLLAQQGLESRFCGLQMGADLSGILSGRASASGE
ncbi:EndoU domain-containing protein [Streptomyces sp. NPDC005122]